MNDYYRLTVLTLSCFISYLCYWLFCIVVVIYSPLICVSFQDYWLANVGFGSPFFLFLLVFVLLSLWALLESFIVLLSRKQVLLKGGILIIVFAFLTCFYAGHYTLWQAMGVIRGDIQFADYLFKTKGLENAIKSRKLSRRYPDWNQFIYEERCEKGLNILSMTEEEKGILFEKYRRLIENSFQSK